MINEKGPVKTDWAFFALTSGLRQGAADGTECVADLGSEQAHDRDDNDGDECENNGILDEPLAFFLRCKQHENLPFNKKTDGLLRTSLSADSMTISGVKSYMEFYPTAIQIEPSLQKRNLETLMFQLKFTGVLCSTPFAIELI